MHFHSEIGLSPHSDIIIMYDQAMIPDLGVQSIGNKNVMDF